MPVSNHDCLPAVPDIDIMNINNIYDVPHAPSSARIRANPLCLRSLPIRKLAASLNKNCQKCVKLLDSKSPLPNNAKNAKRYAKLTNQNFHCQTAL